MRLVCKLQSAKTNPLVMSFVPLSFRVGYRFKGSSAGVCNHAPRQSGTYLFARRSLTLIVTQLVDAQ